MSILLYPDVVRDIVKTIQDHVTVMSAVMFGKDSVPPEVWQLAVDMGLVDPADPAASSFETLFSFGALLAQYSAISQQPIGTWSTAEVLEAVKLNPIPRTVLESRSARIAAARGAQLCVGLGNRAGATLGSDLIEADAELDRFLRTGFRDVIASRLGDPEAQERVRQRGIDQGLPEGFFDDAFRGTVKRVVSDMGHLTGEWTRDLQRIAQTELHSAVQEGFAEVLKEEQETETRVVLCYKLPRPSACRKCVEAYLEGGVPRIFALDDLMANGANIGVKAADVKPTVRSLHPWCGCELIRVPSSIQMPQGWRSGQGAPTVIGELGRLVF